MLLWSFFETKTGDALQTKCAAALQSPEHAEAQIAHHRAVVKARK
ncbi:MAG: hypothetical protein Q8L48_43830 [Archangium sp.]|nr:hypothetical protein [Archangium sp.]